LPHLEKILKQGFILSGRYLCDDETILGGWEKLPYIYCNIYLMILKIYHILLDIVLLIS